MDRLLFVHVINSQKLARVLQTTLTELMVRESLREVRVRERSKSDFTEMHWLGLVWARSARFLFRSETNSVRIGVSSYTLTEKGLLWQERQVRIIEVAQLWMIAFLKSKSWIIFLFVVLFGSFVLAVFLVHWLRMLPICILQYISSLGKRLIVWGRWKVKNRLQSIPYSLSGALP